jgi:hypothetical protein
MSGQDTTDALGSGMQPPMNAENMNTINVTQHAPCPSPTPFLYMDDVDEIPPPEPNMQQADVQIPDISTNAPCEVPPVIDVQAKLEFVEDTSNIHIKPPQTGVKVEDMNLNEQIRHWKVIKIDVLLPVHGADMMNRLYMIVNHVHFVTPPALPKNQVF